MRNKVIALVSNNIATDQRLIKVGKTLEKHSYNFVLVGTQHRGKPSLSHIPFKTHRVPIFFQRNVWFYAELQLRLFLKLIRLPKKNVILLANDLDTLLPAYLVSKMYGLPLVFDSHEIFSELPSLREGSIQKKVWGGVEKRLVPQVSKMYTVSKSYAKFFEKKYGISPNVVSNFPMRVEKASNTNTLSKSDYGSKGKKVLIYQGAINYSRGIDKMILAMEHLPQVHLWIVGDGPMLETYRNLVDEKQLLDQIKFLGKLVPEKLKQVTPLADLGLSLEEDNGLSYRYALPNKVFDYIHAGIPVLGSADLPEVANIIHKYNIGNVIENHNPKHIAKRIEHLLQQPSNKFLNGLEQAQLDLNWENQEATLLSIFRSFR